MKRGKRETTYFYAIRITKKGKFDGVKFLARKNASAPNLFWFHEDALKWLQVCRKSKDCNCGKCKPSKCDIIKVFVSWPLNGTTYNEPGDMFRSARELKMIRKRQEKGQE